MNKDRINQKHAAFIRLVSEGATLEQAYATACNKNTTSVNCRSQGSRLSKRYALEIQKERERIQNIVQAASDSKVEKIASMSIMDKAERMDYLSKIARGEIKINQAFVVNKSIEEHLVEPSASERRAAIAELNKMDGAYPPVKTEVSVKKIGKDLAEEDYV